MSRFDTLISHVTVADGSGAETYAADVAVRDGRIAHIASAGTIAPETASACISGHSLVLAPGFIDVHTHDDLAVIRTPDMLPKISQGVTTIIAGNCGISAAVVLDRHATPPDPLNLLGERKDFAFAEFAAYADAVDAARPAVNVAALIGHTALRARHMDDLSRPATTEERKAMTADLRKGMAQGALGLSTGLAYGTAQAAPSSEVHELAEVLRDTGGIYCSHLRTEAEAILEAMEEAYEAGVHARVPVVISHLKCNGIANHGRSHEVLSWIDRMRSQHPIGCDCYPYAASSSTLDLGQVNEDIEVLITWSVPHPEMGGKNLTAIAAEWQTDLVTAASRLQPAGAVYFGMDEADVERILAHPATVIGSDGLPNDPRPHPRLWGAFPRVLSRYVRERGVLTLPDAIRRMTGQSADRYGLSGRGYIREDYAADLVLFDPDTIHDTATFTEPKQAAQGIHAVWVNGALSWRNGAPTPSRKGQFLKRPTSLH